MKALILNSGLGRRMGALTSEQPKCMTELYHNDTILSRQLRMLANAGITEVVITTGLFRELLEEYCASLELPLHIRFVQNPDYESTNYIYSIYCAREYLEDDVLLMHGDLVFEDNVLEQVLNCGTSCMAVSSTSVLPEKDFKAVIQDGKVKKVGVEYFEQAEAAQPLYKLQKKDWIKWLDKIISYCEKGDRQCYAAKSSCE